MSKTVTGLDVLLKNKIHLLRGKRVALLAHAGSLTGDLRWAVEVFHQHPEINLVKLFGPEHGLFGVAQDMEQVGDEVEPITGLPVKSLYGSSLETLTPSQKDLAGIDLLVVDLQDIGTRFYTYIYTMAFCMQACAKAGIPVVVLDRPNPLGGNVVQGNVITDMMFRSFVGWFSLPVRHGLTIGELAQFWNESESIRCDLTVVSMQNWTRDLYFDETGLTFVNPSPNMPTVQTAIVYPGGCLVEATEVSEGRGTTKPFEWIGLPNVNAGLLSSEMNALNLPGVQFRPYHFKPNFQKHAGRVCHGVEILVSDRKIFDSYQTTLLLLQMINKQFPKEFKWRAKPYEFVDKIAAIDLLTGDASYRENFLDMNFVRSQSSIWQKQCLEFKKNVKAYLLY